MRDASSDERRDADPGAAITTVELALAVPTTRALSTQELDRVIRVVWAALDVELSDNASVLGVYYHADGSKS
jgi:hypothetical protein